MEEKARRRRAIRERLAALDPVTDRAVARRLADRVLGLPEVARAERIFTCLSFGPEVDTWGLVERLLGDGREVFVPRSTLATRQITVHRYPCRLETLGSGTKTSGGTGSPLRQPPEDEPAVDPATLDVALVLGLGFDPRGYRLGFGAGFFDRFLAGRAFPAVGLTREIQVVDRLPVEAHDIALDAVVTEERVLRGPPDDLAE